MNQENLTVLKTELEGHKASVEKLLSDKSKLQDDQIRGLTESLEVLRKSL